LGVASSLSEESGIKLAEPIVIAAALQDWPGVTTS
jgi:hypothetical protein